MGVVRDFAVATWSVRQGRNRAVDRPNRGCAEAVER